VKQIVCLILFLSICWSSVSGEPINNDERVFEQFKLFLDAITYINNNYKEEVDIKKLIYLAVGGIADNLDPYSVFLDSETNSFWASDDSGNYSGVGIRVVIENKIPVVITPLANSPASKAGILPGDRIIKIDGQTMYGTTMLELIRKLRGQPGKKVRLTIDRDSLRFPVVYELVIKTIEVPAVKSRLINDKIAYVRLYEFNRDSSVKLKAELNKFDKNKINGLILDLRNNPGGFVNEAIAILKCFVGDKKKLSYTLGRTSESCTEYFADEQATWSDTVPIVILQNRGSASASELIAGVLQDMNRARLVGTRSFGKTTMQMNFPLQDGCVLHLTIGKFYTASGKLVPTGDNNTEPGIKPDFEVSITPEVEQKLQEDVEQVPDETLDRAIKLLK
jgi:carboxyl-terminal processing protease